MKTIIIIYLNNICIIAIQAHIFYEDLTFEVINKINNIPFRHDIFITTISENKKVYIEQILKKYSHADNYIIDVVENRGRDVLPFIIQMKNHIKKYKYICHIHSKKTMKYPLTGNLWRRYLYNNLLGSKDIISEILSDFENNDKLGLIFPKIYYKLLLFFNCEISKSNIKKMNYLIKQIYPHVKIIDRITEFPAGNMFWGRISAIYQIFNINIEKKFPKEFGQLDFTIMHAIERIWAYLTKLNGYYYRNIFKHS